MPNPTAAFRVSLPAGVAVRSSVRRSFAAGSFAVCFALSPLVGAEPKLDDPVFSTPLSAEAKAGVFRRVSERLSRTEVIRSPFEQHKKIAVLRRPLVSEGDFLFSKTHGIVWSVTKPIPSVFVITPEGIVSEGESGRRVRIDAKEQPVVHGFTRIFLSLFGGDASELEKSFSLYFTGDEKKWTLGLVGKGVVGRRYIHHLVLKGSKTVDEILVVEPTGDRTRIRFLRPSSEPPALSEGERNRFRL